MERSRRTNVVAVAGALVALLVVSVLGTVPVAADPDDAVPPGAEAMATEPDGSGRAFPPPDLVLNPPAGTVALTFDDGPHPTYTGQILDILDAHDAKATFFVLGERVDQYPALVAEIVERGHSVQNHTYLHPFLTEVDDDRFRQEVRDTTAAIEDAGAPAPRCLRPPYGDFLGSDGGARVRQLAREEGGLELRTWHEDAEDWNLALTPAQVRQRAAAIDSGEILLLHDGLDQSHRTVAVLPGILEDLAARGLSTEPICQSWDDFGFFDVRRRHAFFEEIRWMADSGIAGGYADNTYRPAVVVSRQAMAAFLWRLAGNPPVAPGAPTFWDVPVGHPFRDAVRWLAQAGIAEGFADGSFGAVAPVSRQAMAAFLWRLAGEPPVPPGAAAFSDVSGSHRFHHAIAWMAGSGISEGYQDGTFRPTAPVTRQAMAAFLQRYDAEVG